MRQAVTFKEKDINSFLNFQNSGEETTDEGQEQAQNIIEYFIGKGKLIGKADMFKRLKNVLIPFAKLAMHMKEQYDFTLSREEASKTPMVQFVRSKWKDDELRVLYNDVIEKAMHKFEGLPYIYENYGPQMKFSLACDEIQNIVEEIGKADAPICRFLVVEDPSSEEAFMTALLDALIDQQNSPLEIFEEIYQNELTHSQLVAKKIKKSVRNANVAEMKEFTIAEIEEDDIIHLEDDILDLLIGRAYS